MESPRNRQVETTESAKGAAGLNEGGVSRFFAANMAQLMVFLNGLVLTVIAYFILSVFIHNMAETESGYARSEAQRAITERLAGMEQSLKSAATIMALSGNVDEKLLLSRLRYSAPGIEKFSRLLWIQQSGGVWQSKDLVSPREEDNGYLAALPILAAEEGANLYSYIASNSAYQTGGILVFSDLPGTKYQQEQAEPVIRERAFALAKIYQTGSGVAMMIGVARVSDVLGADFLQLRDEVQRIAINDMRSGRPVYYMDYDFSGQEIIDSDMARMEIMVPLGDAAWKMQVQTSISRELIYLKKAPLIMLVIGVVFTFAGTMYVRNNQRQSLRVSAMNKALAQKNYELGTQAAERERLNQMLRRTEYEYRTIIDAVSDIIFETSTTGNLVFLNDSWERITGFSPKTSLKKNLLDLIYPNDQSEQRDNFEQMVRGKREDCHFFTRLRTADGSYRSVEMSFSMLRQEDGKNPRVVGTITDIEERRRAEKALGEAEKKYRTIVENAAGGIYQLTHDGKFISANPAMAHILGYSSPEQLMAGIRNAHIELYADSRERMQFLYKLEAVGIFRNFETQIVTRDGHKVWISENARVVKDDDGKVEYYEGSIEDITRRKEVEMKLREAKVHSDLASRAKSEFLANMSHELRTPLNAIIGFSEIIRNEVLGPLNNRQYKEYIADIYDSGRKLLTIINEILDVSRIETGQRQLNEGLVDMDLVVKSCLDFMRPKTMTGKLMVVNLMAGVVPKIIGEELAIKQILLNLLSNAIKYTGEGGRITLSHEVDHEGQLRISITDTGIGLDESEIAKALSPFGQVESAFNRAGSGAGLGLTLVDSLIRLHGGRLELFSQKGIGTTVTIIFPAKRVTQEQKQELDQSLNKPGAEGEEETDGDGTSTRSLQ